MNSVKVFAPATVANVGPGFDVLGLAINQPGDTVIATRSNSPGCILTKIEGDQGQLPTDPSKNTATASVTKLLEHLEVTTGIGLELYKNMPLGSGLGSSAASTVAALVAANELLGAPLARRELLPFAIEGERVACGVGHADNVAPALLGGIVLILGKSSSEIVSLPVPADLWCAVVHPDIEIRTEDARKVLRKDVSLQSAILQCGNLAGLVASFFMSDYDLMSKSLQDELVEPHRSLLIPGFSKAKNAATEAGALGTSISGAGPAIFSLCKGQDTAEAVAEKVVAVFSAMEINATPFVSQVNPAGAKIL